LTNTLAIWGISLDIAAISAALNIDDLRVETVSIEGYPYRLGLNTFRILAVKIQIEYFVHRLLENYLLGKSEKLTPRPLATYGPRQSFVLSQDFYNIGG
jgi:hypothetical protein